jgi:aspartyl-tRNA(Asn)/glutamyl-tRNA(Gln) amidotransferase subunit B
MATVYEPVIGLEVHAQLLSESKLFCGCSTRYGAPPNTHVCPVCLGLPGALPSPNRAAVEMAVQAAQALGCAIRPHSRFARKNYFYPDLAKGYQISQFDEPLAEHGALELPQGRVGIRRLHLEEDAAKNLHGEGGTRVDFNRAGVPLMEIVSEADISSAEQAEAYLKQLRETLMFLQVNDGNLEEGSFRCDANVSIRPRGAAEFGTRTELKNINSFRFVRQALEHEIARQESILSGGGHIEQQTRTWDEDRGKTILMRGKEEAHDYRYFPDPDLPPLVFSQQRVDELRAGLAELATEKRPRWQSTLGLTADDAGVLTGHPEVAHYFEAVAEALTRRWGPTRQADAGKRAANFIQAEVLRHVQTEGLRAWVPVTAEQLAELLALVEDGTINRKMAKDVFAEMVETGEAAQRIVDARGLAQVTDASAIEQTVREVLDENPGAVEQYRAGKKNVLGFLVGQVMKKTGGAANPKIVNETLERLLGK